MSTLLVSTKKKSALVSPKSQYNFMKLLQEKGAISVFVAWDLVDSTSLPAYNLHKLAKRKFEKKGRAKRLRSFGTEPSASRTRRV